jgi:hypothetical protein
MNSNVYKAWVNLKSSPLSERSKTQPSIMSHFHDNWEKTKLQSLGRKEGKKGGREGGKREGRERKEGRKGEREGLTTMWLRGSF